MQFKQIFLEELSNEAFFPGNKLVEALITRSGPYWYYLHVSWSLSWIVCVCENTPRPHLGGWAVNCIGQQGGVCSHALEFFFWPEG